MGVFHRRTQMPYQVQYILVNTLPALLSRGAKTNAMDIGDAEKLVTPIFEGATSLIQGWVEDLLMTIVGWMTNDFTPTSDRFYQAMGVGSISNGFFNFFYAVAYFLLIAVFLVNLLSLTVQGFNDQKNSLFELLVRFVFSCLFVALSRTIFDNMAHWAQQLYDAIPTSIEHESEGTSILDTIVGLATDRSIIINLIRLILFISMIIEFIKLILEIIERYIVCELLKITAPMYCGMFVSRTTSSIAMNGIRMYISQLFLLLMNQFFALIACALISHSDNSVMGYLLIIAFLKTAQRIDAHMKSMGLTVAQTGGAFLGAIAGGAVALSGLSRISRAGAGIASAALANSAVAGGNPDIMKASQKLGAFSKNGLAGAIAPIGEGESLKELVAKGGGTNAASASGITGSKARAALENTATKAYSQGAYTSVAQLDRGTQTAVARNILGGKNADGKSAFAAATGGFEVGDITEARIDAKGIITGHVKKGDKEFDFTATSRDTGFDGIAVAGTDGSSYFVATSGDDSNIMGEAAGTFEYTPDGQSNLSSMVDFDIDDERLASMGAASYSCEDNVLTVRDGDGNAIYQHSLTTGNEVYGGTKAYAGNGNRSEDITPTFGGVFNEDSFKGNGSLAGMIDGKIQPGSGTYHRDSNTYSFKTTTGDIVRVAGTSNAGVSSLNKKGVKTVDLGDRGSYTITQTRVKAGSSGGGSSSGGSAGATSTTTSSGRGGSGKGTRTTGANQNTPNFDDPNQGVRFSNPTPSTPVSSPTATPISTSSPSSSPSPRQSDGRSGRGSRSSGPSQSTPNFSDPNQGVRFSNPAQGSPTPSFNNTAQSTPISSPTSAPTFSPSPAPSQRQSGGSSRSRRSEAPNFNTSGGPSMSSLTFNNTAPSPSPGQSQTRTARSNSSQSSPSFQQQGDSPLKKSGAGNSSKKSDVARGGGN